ncbi:MAG: hypothetical protein J1E65_07660, partial [Lachnospiraceae bacterium]|nr:hypothetical protein [Lachnospiraceae bacterium]
GKPGRTFPASVIIAITTKRELILSAPVFWFVKAIDKTVQFILEQVKEDNILPQVEKMMRLYLSN